MIQVERRAVAEDLEPHVTDPYKICTTGFLNFQYIFQQLICSSRKNDWAERTTAE